MYFYPKAIPLHEGDLVDLDCTYDTRNVDHLVNDGLTANDEMCWGFLYVTGIPSP
jgi:hypothetical protein